MDNLFESLDRNKGALVSVPISDYTAEFLGFKKRTQTDSRYYGYSGSTQANKEQEFGVTFGSGAMFDSAKAIIGRAEKIKNIGDRNEVLKELYAALNTAAISQSLNTPK